jgi:hypothetical protein
MLLVTHNVTLALLQHRNNSNSCNKSLTAGLAVQAARKRAHRAGAESDGGPPYGARQRPQRPHRIALLWLPLTGLQPHLEHVGGVPKVAWKVGSRKE